MNETVKALTAQPPVYWRKDVDRILADPDKWGVKLSVNEMLRHIDGEIERLARYRGYLNARHGKQDHAAAVKESNRLVAKIRKALGYTYPRNDYSF